MRVPCVLHLRVYCFPHCVYHGEPGIWTRKFSQLTTSKPDPLLHTAPGKRWQHPTTSRPRASQGANMSVPSWDRLHVQWDPPASVWPRCFQGQGKLLSLCEMPTLQNPGGLGGRGCLMKLWGEGFLEEKPPHSYSWGAATCSFSCSQACWGHMARKGTKPALCELSIR